MKRLYLSALLAGVILAGSGSAAAERIVIMHTNDTHSQIDPASDGRGGVARRKVLIDSIRAAEPYTLLVDAGDALQGTAYFTIYGGEVESKVLNALGYDYAILGNHEFDNGMKALGDYMRSVNAPFISTNYDVTGTPLEGAMERYRIVDIGGKRIGLIGINVDPDGIIASDKSEGVVYQDAYRAANSTAWHLKHNEGVDYVVALTHIGYEYDDMPDDIKLVAGGNDIDVVIGGHSHTTINPGSPESLLTDRDGKPVVVAQTGSTGASLGVVTIDTDNGTVTSRLIPVDDRLDSRVDQGFADMLRPYRHGVDSLKSIVVGKSRIEADRKGESVLNFVCDFVDWRGRGLTSDGRVDLALANRGGIRSGMERGNVTRGGIMEMLPFDNRVVVVDMSGADLMEMLGINARMKRVGFSRPVRVEIKGDKVVRASIDGVQIDPDKTYRIATIDYLANGGDYMTPLANGKTVASSDRIMNLDVIDYIGQLRRRTINDNPVARETVIYE